MREKFTNVEIWKCAKATDRERAIMLRHELAHIECKAEKAALRSAAFPHFEYMIGVINIIEGVFYSKVIDVAEFEKLKAAMAKNALVGRKVKLVSKMLAWDADDCNVTITEDDVGTIERRLREGLYVVSFCGGKYHLRLYEMAFHIL